MLRRRTAAVMAALCLAAALTGGPVASAQVSAPGARVEVTDLPVLSQLPPLPVTGDPSEVEDVVDSPVIGFSGVQTVALGLAAAVLVAGGMGLALVTRRSRAGAVEGQTRPAGPAG